MIKVYLSPSNHGVGANRCLRSGCYEDKHTRPMADACAKHLLATGKFEVIVASAGKTMSQRCSEANAWGADLYVPIHTNASSTESTRYLMFMCWQTSGKYRALYNAVEPHFAKIYNGKSMLVQRTDLFEINTPNAMTFYTEMGFHTNSYDCNNFIHNPEPIGKALAHGICDYYGVKTSTNPAASSSKSVDAIAKEVIAGKWGNGQDRKDRLTSAGYNYSAVQAKVNEMLSQPNGKSIDELAREVIRGDWGNGAARKRRLIQAGYDYSAVQTRVNELLE